MGRLFWILAVLGIGMMVIVNSAEKGDFDALQEGWKGPQGAIVARGLPAQIELIEQIADDHGWEADCTRQIGELTLVQFTPTFWAKFSQSQEIYNEVSILSTSSALLVTASGENQDCGEGQSATSSGPAETDPETFNARQASLNNGEVLLAVGTPAEMASDLALAQRCGLEGFVFRPPTSSEKEQMGGDVPPDWQVLGGVLTHSKLNQMHCFVSISLHERSREE